MDDLIFDNSDEPVMDEPVMDESVMDEPVMDEPVMYEPAMLSENEIIYLVSDDCVTKEDINIVIEEIRGLREDVKNKQFDIVFGSVSGNVSGSDSSVGLVSDNIINKPLKDYSTSESLVVVGILIIIGVCLTYIIHKSIFKIRR